MATMKMWTREAEIDWVNNKGNWRVMIKDKTVDCTWSSDAWCLFMPFRSIEVVDSFYYNRTRSNKTAIGFSKQCQCVVYTLFFVLLLLDILRLFFYFLAPFTVKIRIAIFLWLVSRLSVEFSKECIVFEMECQF